LPDLSRVTKTSAWCLFLHRGFDQGTLSQQGQNNGGGGNVSFNIVRMNKNDKYYLRDNGAGKGSKSR